MLRKCLLVGVMGMLVGGAAMESNAGIVALWNFDSSTVGSAPNTTVSSGSGTLSLNPGGGSSLAIAGAGGLPNKAVEFKTPNGSSQTFTILVQITGSSGLRDYVLTYSAQSSAPTS